MKHFLEFWFVDKCFPVEIVWVLVQFVQFVFNHNVGVNVQYIPLFRVRHVCTREYPNGVGPVIFLVLSSLDVFFDVFKTSTVMILC